MLVRHGSFWNGVSFRNKVQDSKIGELPKSNCIFTFWDDDLFSPVQWVHYFKVTLKPMSRGSGDTLPIALICVLFQWRHLHFVLTCLIARCPSGALRGLFADDVVIPRGYIPIMVCSSTWVLVYCKDIDSYCPLNTHEKTDAKLFHSRKNSMLFSRQEKKENESEKNTNTNRGIRDKTAEIY